MEKICRVSAQITKILQKVEMAVGSACLVLLLALMLFNAGARYLFDFPVIWSDEMNNFFFVWLGFTSCAYIMGNDGHMRVTALVNFLPPKGKYYVGMFTNAVMLAAFAWFIGPFWRLLSIVTYSGLLRIPLKYIYFILPLSFGLMCVHIVNNMLQSTLIHINSRKEEANI